MNSKKEILKSQVAKGNIEKVIKELIKLTCNHPKSNHLILIQSQRLAKSEKSHNLGLLNREDYDTIRNKVTKEIILVVESVEDLDNFEQRIDNDLNKSIETEFEYKYFIFPGLKEIVIGCGLLSLFEFFTGSSAAAKLGIQTLLSTLIIFIITLIICIIVVIQINKKTEFNFLHLLILVFIFILGVSTIGYFHPELSITIPKINDNYTPLRLAKIIFYVVKDFGNKIGWITFLGSIALLIHVLIKHNSIFNKIFKD